MSLQTPDYDSQPSSSTPTPTPTPSTSTTQQTRSSLSQSASSKTLTTIDAPLSKSRLLVKHGKYVLAGGAGCWWLGLKDAIVDIIDGEGGWIRRTMIAAMGLHGLTICIAEDISTFPSQIIFLYLVAFLPWLRGYIPNYPKWQQSARLRAIVPVLTATIFLGWISLVVSLSQAGKRSAVGAIGDALKGIAQGDMSRISGHQGLSLLGSMAGATALYTLTLGLLGLIPSPSGVPIRKKEE